MQDLDKDKRYVLAVSGGADSMAMLHMAWKLKLDIIVCHVNYQKRATSDRDENIVRSFCSVNQIPFLVKKADINYKGNFQHYARKLRYDFFYDAVQVYQAKALLTAHHKDDDLETALLRQQQGRQVGYYGIHQNIELNGMCTYRPLLEYWKEDLVQYCHDHTILFGEDESNMLDQYSRNRIRHHVIEPMTKQEKEKLLTNFKERNEELNKIHDDIREMLKRLVCPEKLPLAVLHSTAFPELLLRFWLTSLHEQAHQLNQRQINQIMQLGLNDHGSKEVSLFSSYVVVREYGFLHFFAKTSDEKFRVVLSRLVEMQTPWFKTQLTGSLKDGLTVYEEDFPLMIRNVQPGDRIRCSFGHKKVHRFLIDRKIPAVMRKNWPIVCNCRNEVIFVCGMGSNLEHFTNTPNLFVVKYECYKKFWR